MGRSPTLLALLAYCAISTSPAAISRTLLVDRGSREGRLSISGQSLEQGYGSIKTSMSPSDREWTVVQSVERSLDATWVSPMRRTYPYVGRGRVLKGERLPSG